MELGNSKLPKKFLALEGEKAMVLTWSYNMMDIENETEEFNNIFE